GRRHQLVLGAGVERVGGPGVRRGADTAGGRRGGDRLHQRRPGPSAGNGPGVQRGEHAAVGAAG
ncbi:type VI secretion system protein Vgr, partial [Pluralibacter gergoviae]